MKPSRLLLACLLMIPVPVLAGGFSYDYVELGYQHTTPRNGNASKGPELAFSWTLPTLGVQVLGGYARLNTPDPAGNITGKNSLLGIRGETAFGDSTSFYTEMLYLNQESNPLGFDIADSGYQLRLGLRHKLNAWLELDGSVAHNYLGQSSNQARLGLRFGFLRVFDAGLSLTRDNLRNTTTEVTLRWYY